MVFLTFAPTCPQFLNLISPSQVQSLFVQYYSKHSKHYWYFHFSLDFGWSVHAGLSKGLVIKAYSMSFCLLQLSLSAYFDKCLLKPRVLEAPGIIFQELKSLLLYRCYFILLIFAATFNLIVVSIYTFIKNTNSECTFYWYIYRFYFLLYFLNNK